VLSGAGARGAYEAGVLSVLLPALVDECGLDIVVGTSAGALNAALIAAFLPEGAERAAEELQRAWTEVRPASVHRRPARSFAHLVRWHLRHRPATAAALLDTHPLGPTVRRLAGAFEQGVGGHGRLRSLAVVASSYGRSRAVVFVAGEPPREAADDEDLEYRCGPLTLEHLLASSAFPIAFPPQWIPDPDGKGGDWFLDGGVHLNTPLKPAVDLGATRVLIVGATPMTDLRALSPDQPPDLMDAAGQLLHAMAAGHTARDLRALRKDNLAPAPGRRRVGYCAVGPDDDELSRMGAAVWRSEWWRLPLDLFRYRALGPFTHQCQRPGQVLSYLCFDPRFLGQALDKGRRDGEAVLRRGGGLIPWEG
jgi:NTE family protein